jgi:hypothetical protein
MRKGPPEHAGEFDLGERRIGNDGNMWEITQTKKGVRRWKKVSSRKTTRRKRTGKRRRTIKRSKSKTKKIDWAKKMGFPKKKGKIYFIMDNGGRPFQVVILGNKVSIYEQLNWKDYDTIQDYTKLIKTFSNVKKIFIGKDRKLGKAFDGNSILLRLSKDQYVYIGSWIYEFVTKDDTIVAYFSKVGNSGVPYPVALGEKNVYFMLEPTIGLMYGRRRRDLGRGNSPAVVPRSVVPPNVDWEDAYTLFYGHKGEKGGLSKYAEKFYKMKVIKNQHW